MTRNLKGWTTEGIMSARRGHNHDFALLFDAIQMQKRDTTSAMSERSKARMIGKWENELAEIRELIRECDKEMSIRYVRGK